eukprot:COSAG03_NODE_1558_length_3875_cov_18.126324_2_plen_167_part_00
MERDGVRASGQRSCRTLASAASWKRGAAPPTLVPAEAPCRQGAARADLRQLVARVGCWRSICPPETRRSARAGPLLLGVGKRRQRPSPEAGAEHSGSVSLRRPCSEEMRAAQPRTEPHRAAPAVYPPQCRHLTASASPRLHSSSLSAALHCSENSGPVRRTAAGAG